MEFDKVIEARRSVRKYRGDAVPEEAVRAMIQAARLAPSGFNVQPWRFIVVRDTDARAALSAATPSQFVGEAPVIIVCCVDREAFEATGARVRELIATGASNPAAAERYGDGEFTRNMNTDWAYSQLSMYTAIAISHMMLKAVDLELGTCWIGYFDAEKVRMTTGVADRYGILALLPVGYPADNAAPRPRLAVEELVLSGLN